MATLAMAAGAAGGWFLGPEVKGRIGVFSDMDDQQLRILCAVAGAVLLPMFVDY